MHKSLDIKKIIKNIDNLEDLTRISLNTAKESGNLFSEQSLKNIALSSWEEIYNIFPNLYEIVEEMNKHMLELSIDVPRSSYLFGWLLSATKMTTILSTDSLGKEIDLQGKTLLASDVLSYLKLKGIVIDVILDDLGDQYAGKNSLVMISIIENIINEKFDDKDLNSLLHSESKYILFFQKVWGDYIQELQDFGGEHTVLVLISEYNKVINSCKNKSELNSLIERDELSTAQMLHLKIERDGLYNSTMHIVINGILDSVLIGNKEFDAVSRYPELVVLLDYLETLGRIGDDISTWKREVRKNDFTSLIARDLVLSKNIPREDIRQLNIDKKVIDESIALCLNKYKLYWEKILDLDLTHLNKVINIDDLFARYLSGISIQILSEGYK